MAENPAARSYETVLNLLEGYVSNPKRAAGEYAAMLPQVQQLMHCGVPDIEKRAAELAVAIEKAEARKQKPAWQFWK